MCMEDLPPLFISAISKYFFTALNMCSTVDVFDPSLTVTERISKLLHIPYLKLLQASKPCVV